MSIFIHGPVMGAVNLKGAPTLISTGPRQPMHLGIADADPYRNPPTKSLADTAGNVTVGTRGGIPAITGFESSGVVWKEPAAWQFDHARTVRSRYQYEEADVAYERSAICERLP